MTWTCQKAGQKVEYHDEPETSFGRRFQSSFVGFVAPELWL
jgi:hypothetical protein